MKAFLTSLILTGIFIGLYLLVPDPYLGIELGDTFNDVTKEQVCVPGYSRSVRNVSTSVKKKIYKLYKVDYPSPKGMYEVDHFIPLSLSGSNSIKNLWLQPEELYDSNGLRMGFREKDKVEYLAWRMLCKTDMTLTEAIDMVRNWERTYYEHFIKLGSATNDFMEGYVEEEEGNP